MFKGICRLLLAVVLAAALWHAGRPWLFVAGEDQLIDMMPAYSGMPVDIRGGSGAL